MDAPATDPPRTIDPAQIRTTDAQATYRYLRIGMLAVVVMLAASVIIERTKVDCWQTSISAYYYTPARAVFVGGLMAIGFALIIIKGATPVEDILLNVAGMFAPVVALVPTSGAGSCWSIPPVAEPREYDDPVTREGPWVLAEWVEANIRNNIGALLFVGIVGLIAAAVLASITNRSARAILDVGSPGTRIGLAVTFGILVIAWWLFENWSDFDTSAHGIAAVSMFVFLAAAAIVAGVHRLRAGRRRVGWAYLAIGVAMVLTYLVLLPFSGDWDHHILILEMIEIGWFAIFWGVQTGERWKEDVVTASVST